MDLLVADSSDTAALTEIASRTKVVATTIGPFVELGEPLVAACAAAGSAYVDLTGESEFVDRMWLAHHDTAVASGARIVHACGFDSIPHDLGVYYTVQQLPSEGPVTVRGVVRSNGTVSGGTFHSALDAFSRVRQARSAHSERRKAEGRPEGRSSRAVAGKPHRDSVLGYWLLPLPTIDPTVVARSGAALAAYGPKFRYSHYAGTKTLRYAAGAVAAVGALGLAAQVGPVRELLGKRMPRGQGPTETRRRKTWFSVDFVAEAGGGTAAHPRLRRGPRLHRDRDDAGGVRALPRLRHQPADRGPGHHRRGHGRQPAHPPPEGRDELRGRRLSAAD